MGRVVSRWSSLTSGSANSVELGWAWKSSSGPRMIWPRSTFCGARTSSTCSDSPRSSRSASSCGGIWGSEASGIWLVSSRPAENATAPVAGGRACDHGDAWLLQGHRRAEHQPQNVLRGHADIGVLTEQRVVQLHPPAEVSAEPEPISPGDVGARDGPVCGGEL